jgi:hypothetical protein
VKSPTVSHSGGVIIGLLETPNRKESNPRMKSYKLGRYHLAKQLKTQPLPPPGQKGSQGDIYLFGVEKAVGV